MTPIQQQTFHAASSGQDVLGRARTGTGKTLAFLLPALESALRMGRVPGPPLSPHYLIRNNENVDGIYDESSQQKSITRGGIAILIISPTRELAMQIHHQAQMITSSHTNSNSSYDSSFNERQKHKYPMISQVMYGGTSRNSDITKLETNMPFILVATPGRLIDHMQSTTLRLPGGQSIPFRELIQNVSVWVLDEADRCLDMGFRKDMEYILDHKPKEGAPPSSDAVRRHAASAAAELPPAALAAQTLLFSATLPDSLRSIMASHMRPRYLTVDCIQDADTNPASHAHSNVEQRYVTLPPPSSLDIDIDNNDDDHHLNQGHYISSLVSILEDIIHHQNPTDYKIIVFFPTTSTCQFFSHIFNTIYRIPVLEIHSKKSQSNRTIMSTKFRKFSKGILFTTDVSARGVDYPNVTHVIQYGGGAEDKETYLHRLGRTGRAGKAGCGLLVCTGVHEERSFVKRVLKGLEVQHDGRIQALLLNNNNHDGEELLSSEELDTSSSSIQKTKKNRVEINNARLQKIRFGIGMRTNVVLEKMANDAYRSLLGYKIAKMENLGLRSKNEVVEHVNSLAMQMGYLPGKMPTIGPKIIQALGLNGVRGLNVGKEYHLQNKDGGADGRGHSGGRSGERRSGKNGGDRVGQRDDTNLWSKGGGLQRHVWKHRGKEQSGGGGSDRRSNFQQFDDYRWSNFSQ
ncbi:hypothetical protein ACHAWU_000478 [Discostella pseudostelligera]|uniref:ATP-dependent RNA helicase n=1 Tax=Discostella pseudostelligera TaxID=259834 RepID=A0ABD3MBF9_9STRA